MNRARILEIYAAIGETTPMKTDCGALCGAACCRCDDDGRGGVALLPGEAELLAGIEWGRGERDEAMDAPMLVCDGPCEREKRPFLCRVFPLCPVRGREGDWTVRMDARARAVCPLCGSGLHGLDPEFVRGAVRAARLLAEAPEGEAFLTRWAAIEAEFRKPFLF